jgi:adenosylcobinamide-phosphate synthase
VLVGRWGQWIESRVPRGDSKRDFRWGVISWVGVVAPVVTLALLWQIEEFRLLEDWVAEGPEPYLGIRVLEGVAVVLVTVVWTKSQFTLRGLITFPERALARSGESLRREVSLLVNRPTQDLPEPLLYSALVETTAENCTDSVVSPLFYYALFALPGLVAYRAINTLDALWGHWDDRHRYFGRFTARVDHVMNWGPDRLAAAILLVVSGGFRRPVPLISPPSARRTVPSTIRAAARIQQVRLERVGSYVVGEGLRAPGPADVREMLHHVRRVGHVSLLLSLALIGGVVLVVGAFGVL